MLCRSGGTTCVFLFFIFFSLTLPSAVSRVSRVTKRSHCGLSGKSLVSRRARSRAPAPHADGRGSHGFFARNDVIGRIPAPSADLGFAAVVTVPAGPDASDAAERASSASKRMRSSRRALSTAIRRCSARFWNLASARSVLLPGSQRKHSRSVVGLPLFATAQFKQAYLYETISWAPLLAIAGHDGTSRTARRTRVVSVDVEQVGSLPPGRGAARGRGTYGRLSAPRQCGTRPHWLALYRYALSPYEARQSSSDPPSPPHRQRPTPVLSTSNPTLCSTGHERRCLPRDGFVDRKRDLHGLALLRLV